MSGRQEKTLRQTRGISVAARRAERDFEREIVRAGRARIRELDAEALAGMRFRRQFMAWAALAVIAACIVGAIVL